MKLVDAASAASCNSQDESRLLEPRSCQLSRPLLFPRQALRYHEYYPDDYMSDLGIYTPLQDGEIRVLTLDPPTADRSAQIRCRLENVRLLPSRQTGSGAKFKGDDHRWPELYDPRNLEFTAIFKDKTEAEKQVSSLRLSTESPQASLTVTESAGDQSDWRYSWGDYFALSYCWGPKTPEHAILLNDKEVMVGINLFEALCHLRRSARVQQGFKLWIDAICINQTDTVERSKQVALMHNIYALAWQVVIWLGPEIKESSLAMSALRWAAVRSTVERRLDFYQVNPQINCAPILVKWETYSSPLRKDVYRALFYLLNRPYWRRMWILQEVAMARDDAPVICGDECIRWRDVHAAAELIDSDEQRFGRDIIGSVRPRVWKYWTFEFARDRLVSEREVSSERMWKLVMEMMRLQRAQRSTRPASEPGELLKVLHLVQKANVTEQRDKVYGALGLKVVADRTNMEPDYQKNTSDVYQDFSRQLLLADVNTLRLTSRPAGYIFEKRKLDWSVDKLPKILKDSALTPVVGPTLYALQFAGKAAELFVGISCTHNLPSWTICWLCEAVPTKPLQGLYGAGGEQSPLSIPRVLSAQILVFKGLLFDEVACLSSFHAAEVDQLFPTNSTLSKSENAYGDIDGVRTALWKTLVVDSTYEGNMKAPEECSWLLEPRIWREGVAGYYMNDFDLRRFLSRNRDLQLCGYTLPELIFTPDAMKTQSIRSSGRQVYDPGKVQREALSWALNVLAWRRLVGTKAGRIGLVPAATVAGDSLAVILGCDTPLALRKDGSAWTVLGECYIHGVMHGELLKGRATYDDIQLV